MNDTPLQLTPYQPTGPYPQVMLDLPTGAAIPLARAAHGDHILIDGLVLDGAGKPVADTMIETWQADAGGCFHHPDDPRVANADPAFWGYRRVATDNGGAFRIETVKPGPVQDRDQEGGSAAVQAPHILVALYGGGILYRYVTRLYFDDEAAANAADPVLALVPPHRRATLIARADGPNRYHFPIRLQGEDETVFFDV